MYFTKSERLFFLFVPAFQNCHPVHCKRVFNITVSERIFFNPAFQNCPPDYCKNVFNKLAIFYKSF